MSGEEQVQAEVEMIHVLEEQGDAKKHEHNNQWFQKVENQDIASDEDDVAVYSKVVSLYDGYQNYYMETSDIVVGYIVTSDMVSKSDE